jgi:site-specific recombinase XerD
MEKAIDTPGEGMSSSLVTIFDQFLKYLTAKDEYTQGTLRAIDSDMRMFLNYIDETGENEVDLTHVLSRKYLLQFLRDKSISPSTKRRRLFSLRLLASYAHDQDWIDVDPLEGTGIDDLLAGRESIRPTVPTEEEIEAMIEAAGNALGNADPFPMLMIGVLLSGLRVSECVDLKWRDIVVDEAGNLSIAVKDRIIPLSSRISQDAFLVAVHLGRGSLEDTVLSVKRRALSNRFRAFLKRVVLPEGLHPRDLRWRYMLDLVQAGYSEAEIGLICDVTLEYVRRTFPEVAISDPVIGEASDC